MKEKDIKQAFEDAQKDLRKEKQEEREKQIAEVKEIVKRTLLEVEKLKSEKSGIEERLKILKLDIDDLKAGKLERIKERQDKDPLAKEVSVIIIKEKEIIREREVPSPWYQPYTVTWNTNTYPRDNIVKIYNTTTAENNVMTLLNNNTYDCCTSSTNDFILTNSVVKDSVVGAYNLEDKTIHLR